MTTATPTKQKAESIRNLFQGFTLQNPRHNETQSFGGCSESKFCLSAKKHVLLVVIHSDHLQNYEQQKDSNSSSSKWSLLKVSLTLEARTSPWAGSYLAIKNNPLHGHQFQVCEDISPGLTLALVNVEAFRPRRCVRAIRIFNLGKILYWKFPDEQ